VLTPKGCLPPTRYRSFPEITVNLTMPMHASRVPRSLPYVLSQQDMECLLQQPNRVKPTGLRDLAMLEVLDGAGLRVSE
jgi:integrase/recombinase XerD